MSGGHATALPHTGLAWQRSDTWALLLAALWLGATAWARPLMLPDEGRYVGVAWEMLRSGEWLTPTLNGLPYFHKPPLFYWLTAGAMAVWGTGTWPARVAPWLGAVVAACALYGFAWRWSGVAVARAALPVLLAQPMFFVGAQFANLDMLVAGLISATVLLLADAVLSLLSGRPHQRTLTAAYAASALAVLAKGLIGLVIPAAVIVLWLLLMRRPAGVLRLLQPRGMAVWALIAVPWFVVMELRHPGFADYFFMEQHVRRFAHTGFNNMQPAWFYPGVLGAFTLPLWPWLLPALWRAVRSLAGPLKLPHTLPQASPQPQPPLQSQPRAQPLDVAQAVAWLMLAWVLGVVGFFSLPASKLVGYVLPAWPPLAYLAAEGCMAWAAAGRARARAAAGASASASASASGGPGSSASASQSALGAEAADANAGASTTGLHLPRSRRWWAAVGVLAVVGVAAVVGLSLRPTANSRALAQALTAAGVAPERLVLLDRYPFDLPILARWRQPVAVADTWDDPALRQRDTWRKELVDAADLATPAAAAVLVTPARLPAWWCAAPEAWALGTPDAPQRYPVLAGVAPVQAIDELRLWRIDRAQAVAAGRLSCP